MFPRKDSTETFEYENRQDSREYVAARFEYRKAAATAHAMFNIFYLHSGRTVLGLSSNEIITYIII